MRGFLNEIKNVAVNRATNRITSAIGSLAGPIGRGGPPDRTQPFQTNVYNRLNKNPFKGETVIYPEDLGSNDQGHYVQFFINEQKNANVSFAGQGGNFQAARDTGRSTASVKRSATQTLASSICMYMPATVSATQNSKYGEHEIGAAVAGAIAGYKGFQEGEGFINTIKSVKDAVSPVAGEVVKETMKGALDTVAKGAKAAIDINRGMVTNNRLEMVFEGVDRRSFSFSFKMMPKSESEAIAVDKIVNMFRFYMAPSFDGGNLQSRTFIVPATFDIEYYHTVGERNNFLNRISTCVLESCNVTYGGERVQFFRPTSGVNGKGAPPVETSIELSFKELEVITREKIAEGF